jgi:hypothetical protein
LMVKWIIIHTSCFAPDISSFVYLAHRALLKF